MMERGEISRQEFENVRADLFPERAGSSLEATTPDAVQEVEVEETVGDGQRSGVARRTRTVTWLGIAAALLALSVVVEVLLATINADSRLSLSLSFVGIVLASLVVGSLWAGALVARHWWSRGLLGAATLIYLFPLIGGAALFLQNVTADTVAGSVSDLLTGEQTHLIVWVLILVFGIFPLYVVYAVRDRLRLKGRNEVVTTRAAHLTRRVSRVAGASFLIVGLTILLFALAFVLLASTIAWPNASGLAVLGSLTSALLAVLGTGLVVWGEGISEGTSPA